MKLLIAPLNWGLGHASRCIPLVRRHLAAGDEVVLGGDGDSLFLLRRHFPNLRVLPLAPLRLTYSAGNSQVGAMLRALPRIATSSVRDHRLLRQYLKNEHFDLVISDNRFGLCSRQTKCVYITHQLHILLPRPWQWLSPLVSRLHTVVYRRFTEVWVPDTPEHTLSGLLSTPVSSQIPVRYIGPLSRFAEYGDDASRIVRTAKANKDSRFANYDVVAVLSGLEPQRTLLEDTIIHHYANAQDKTLIVQGKPDRPATSFTRGNITLVPHLGDTDLAAALLTARHIIARSGYSTIMDLHALGLLHCTNPQKHIELIPTPGQPEQEYLAHICINYA